MIHVSGKAGVVHSMARNDNGHSSFHSFSNKMHSNKDKPRYIDQQMTSTVTRICVKSSNLRGGCDV